MSEKQLLDEFTAGETVSTRLYIPASLDALLVKYQKLHQMTHGWHISKPKVLIKLAAAGAGNLEKEIEAMRETVLEKIN